MILNAAGDVRRWLDAELGGSTDDAERLFRSVSAAIPYATVPAGLRPHILSRLEASRTGGRQTTSRVRRLATIAALALFGVALVLVGAVVLAPLVAGQLFDLLNFSTRGFVWLVRALDSGLDAWTIVTRASRAIGSAVATPRVALGFVGIEMVGVAALYGLHRMLRLEKETT